jgi:biotin transport system substrate-specific component
VPTGGERTGDPCGTTDARVVSLRMYVLYRNVRPETWSRPMATALTIRDVVPRPQRSVHRLGVDLGLAAAGAALVAVCAQISVHVPWTPVPYTLQTFGVLVVGASLGARTGGLSLLLYLVAGIAGVGVFSDGASGWAEATGPTGGYLAGFVVAALVLGAFAERGQVRRADTSIGAMLTSLVIVFTLGVWWLGRDLGVSAEQALEYGLYPFVPGEVIKLYVAALLVPQAHRFAVKARGGAGQS